MFANNQFDRRGRANQSNLGMFGIPPNSSFDKQSCNYFPRVTNGRNPNNPVASSSDSVDRGRSIIRVTMDED
jgi:hypothetical protein